MIFPLSNADPFAIIGSSPRGISSAGRALEWHSRGQGFDPPILHQKNRIGIRIPMRFFIVASAKINHQLCWWNKKSLDTGKPPFAKLSAGLPTAFRAKGGFVVDDIQSLSHTKWRCQYHIVFAPKYRRKEIYGKLKADIGQIIRKLCEQKGAELIEAEACPDHIHMLVSIPPTLGVAYFMGYLKGKSSLMIFDRHANLKYKYGNRHFWCRG